MMNETMELPEIFIYQSFRYVLGRRIHAVHEWCDWAVRNWERIPNSQKNIIKRELEEAFELAACTTYFKPLGNPCDIEEWKRVRALYKQEESLSETNSK